MTNWPTKEEYRRAMKEWRSNLFDKELRASQMLLDSAGNPMNRAGAGLYVAVFQLGDWMLRCFHADPKANTKPPEDIEKRYQAISEFYQQFHTQIGALVPVELLTQGVRVGQGAGQRVVPIVKMRFLRGAIPLGEFIAPQTMHGNVALMRQLANSWLRMITAMENSTMAHGDLDLTNVMVEAPTGTPILRLVDYDNMFVAKLAGMKQIEGGHPPFQHPGISPRAFDATMDRFSALSIYISLLAIAQEPTLYEENLADESSRLLFDDQDYRDYGLATNKFSRLRKRLGGIVAPYIDALVESLRTNTMPPRLDAISTVVVPVQPTFQQPYGLRPPPPPPPPPPIHHYTPQATPQQLPSAKGSSNNPTPQVPISYRPNLTPAPANNQGRNILIFALVILLVIIAIAIINGNNANQANTTSGIFVLPPFAWLNTLLSFGGHTAALS